MLQCFSGWRFRTLKSARRFWSGSDSSRMECRSVNVSLLGLQWASGHRRGAIQTSAAPPPFTFRNGHTAPKDATKGRSVQDAPGVLVPAKRHLPAVRTAARIDIPKMDSENHALAISLQNASIEGVPEHEPPTDRRSWIILGADFNDRISQAMMNHKRSRGAAK
jgi:hypothetical protein